MTHQPTQEQLEAILEKIHERWAIKLTHSDKDDCVKQAIPAITALIQEAVNEGRVAELKDTVLAQGSYAPDRSYSNDTKGIIVIGVTEVEDRIKQLNSGDK